MVIAMTFYRLRYLEKGIRNNLLSMEEFYALIYFVDRPENVDSEETLDSTLNIIEQEWRHLLLFWHNEFKRIEQNILHGCRSSDYTVPVDSVFYSDFIHHHPVFAASFVRFFIDADQGNVDSWATHPTERPYDYTAMPDVFVRPAILDEVFSK
jgi:hypothetical protein